MADINPSKSLITLNSNWLSYPIERQRFSECVKKTTTQDPNILVCCIWETHFRSEDSNRKKVKGLKEIHDSNSNLKKGGVTILISVKIEFIEKS